jgi:hypothetical protein
MNIHVMLNGAELREESRRLKKREILRGAQNDKKYSFDCFLILLASG